MCIRDSSSTCSCWYSSASAARTGGGTRLSSSSSRRLSRASAKWASPLTGRGSGTVTPVSYTHLDVYKRQVFEGRTTGVPIGLLVENVDQRSKDYGKIMDRFRPGHADYPYQQKYGRRDYRGGGRSSARETALRVAAGAIAKKYLRERYGVEIRGYLAQLGPIRPVRLVWEEVDNNPFFCPCLLYTSRCV